MGTRNLTAVYLDGQYKVAQYGQWDGYPEGQGITALTFLRDKMDLASVLVCPVLLPESSKLLTGDVGRVPQRFLKRWITMEDSDRMMEDHPEFSRNTGAGILEMVQNHSDGMKLQDSINFAADGLFCEWAWVIDLDAGTFEGYCGFGQTPLAENDRFYFLRDLEKDNGYHGVQLAAKWNLDALPTDEEFLAAFKNDEEEETPTF